MEKIAAFRTEDGALFGNELEAERYEAKLKAEKYFDDNGYFGRRGTFCGSDIFEFLDEHRKMIKDYLG